MPTYTPHDVSRLMSVLKKGKSNALTSDVLSGLLALDPQRTNEPLRELISFAIDQGELIGSSSSGYWIIDSVVELNEVLDSLEGRAQGTCNRRNSIRASWNAKHPKNQTVLPDRGCKFNCVRKKY